MGFLASVSNRELNIWATLVLDLVVTVYYFFRVFTMPGALDFTGATMVGIVINIIVFSILFSVVVFSLINARTGEEPKDERDIRFENKAIRVGFAVLFGCVALVIGHIVLNEWAAAGTSSLSTYLGNYRSLATPMIIVQFLLVSLFIASTAKAVTQLVLYRRGAP